MYKEIFLDDINQLMDSMYLFNNVGWINHGDNETRIKTSKIINWHCFDDKKY